MAQCCLYTVRAALATQMSQNRPVIQHACDAHIFPDHKKVRPHLFFDRLELRSRTTSHYLDHYTWIRTSLNYFSNSKKQFRKVTAALCAKKTIIAHINVEAPGAPHLTLKLESIGPGKTRENSNSFPLSSRSNAVKTFLYQKAKYVVV